VKFLFGFLVGAPLWIACARPADTGGSRVPDAPLGNAGVEAGAPGVPWSKKTHEQRMEFMGLTVYPKMKSLFHAQSTTDFAHFRCQTCHGEDMETADFKMPNALYSLSPTDPIKSGNDDNPGMTKFMVESVVPAMKELFAKDDPEMASEFGCLNCHQRGL
jgi:hypothetical protein